jgi:pimeloyl-ACP methyl ester carboxylesterase
MAASHLVTRSSEVIMNFARAHDGTELYFEITGTGTPIVFVHEFGGNYWSWEPQIQWLGRRYCCVTFAARGYPPSQIPSRMESYGQAQAADDIIAVMDAAEIERAHLVGLSMGGFAALHAGLRHPKRVRSIIAAGVGYGAEPEHDAYFKQVSEQVAQQFETLGAAVFAQTYAEGASRVQFQRKDPRGWRQFAERLAQHDSIGAANTMRGVQARRPSLYALKADFAAMDIPVLVLAGDEDDHCLQPGIFLKRTLPRCGLAILPKSGHTLNLEEPALFNQLLGEFLSSVEAEQWGMRDPRADPSQIMRTD